MLERAPNWEREARRLALAAITGRRTGRRAGAPDLETTPPPARDAVMDADSVPDPQLGQAEAKRKIHGDGAQVDFSVGFSMPRGWRAARSHGSVTRARARGDCRHEGRWPRDLSRPAFLTALLEDWGWNFPNHPHRRLAPSIWTRLRNGGPSSTRHPHLGLPSGLGRSWWQDIHLFSEDHVEQRDPPSHFPGLPPQGNTAVHQLHLPSFQALEASFTLVILSFSGS